MRVQKENPIVKVFYDERLDNILDNMPVQICGLTALLLWCMNDQINGIGEATIGYWPVLIIVGIVNLLVCMPSSYTFINFRRQKKYADYKQKHCSLMEKYQSSLQALEAKTGDEHSVLVTGRELIRLEQEITEFRAKLKAFEPLGKYTWGVLGLFSKKPIDPTSFILDITESSIANDIKAKS